ncbi:alpha/beta hydrolase [Zhongshania aquimaris]|uniref:Alpha/beta hydrolase n=1 Tax=Zhongshania aquimaris TaxID=2857107 RepID=A0ABS6VLR3_9GAMM|nr:alpha/beta hydrolase [Zhongshania aquimaris]MBW2939252.1 alpha/beta hydrolase [Zhongshania aquimaris]
MSVRLACEKRFNVEGLNIAAKLWGDDARLPVIALHGWLDNAASFDCIAAQLTDFQVLAIDLPGHGLSDHKPASGNYAIWDDLRVITAVVDQMGWSEFSVIGHSRGANISTLLSATLPDRVSHLICIDGLLPPPEPDSNFPLQLGRYITDFADSKSPRGDKGHASFEAAVAARIRATPMTAKAAALIVERASVKTDDGRYYWRSDRRLKFASPVKLSLGQLQAALDAISSPALLISAKQGLGQWLPKWPFDITKRFVVKEIEGQHHCHMEAQSVQMVAWIKDFIGAKSS